MAPALRLYRSCDISGPGILGWLCRRGAISSAYADSGADSPATACGFLLATAVLNINNLRDINSDRENAKTISCSTTGDVNALPRLPVASAALSGALIRSRYTQSVMVVYSGRALAH